MKNTGILYGTGVGPGDPELITLKAVRTIQKCPVAALPITDPALTLPHRIKNRSEKKHTMTDTIDIPSTCLAYRIALQAVPELSKKELLLLPMPMVKDHIQLKQAHTLAADATAQILKEGKDIAFLTLGDPCIYSTYLYLHQELCRRGYTAKMISGVPSFCAAAAAFGTGLSKNREQLHIIPASYPLEGIFSLSGTKVLMKAGRQLPKVQEYIKEHGKNGSVLIAENCGLPGERLCQDIETFDGNAGYYSIMMIKE